MIQLITMYIVVTDIRTTAMAVITIMMTMIIITMTMIMTTTGQTVPTGRIVP
jgi:hypothetical protein